MDTVAPATIDAAVDELAETLGLLTEPDEYYGYIIDLGRALEPLSEAEHSDAHKVRGCASQVWMVASRDGAGRLHFRGD
jgi:cysteine desulfuration protein SufE